MRSSSQGSPNTSTSVVTPVHEKYQYQYFKDKTIGDTGLSWSLILVYCCKI